MPRARKKSNLAAARARMYHDLIFECAERVFGEEGFAESSMQDLAAEAGVSLNTLYAAFPGKDDIYREIVAVRGAGLLERIRAAETAEGTAVERLRLSIRHIVAYLVEHRSFFRILLQEGRAWGLDPRGDDARESWETGLATVRAVLRDGMASGEFAPGDVDLLAPTLSAVLQIQLAGLLERSPDPDVEALTDEIAGVIGRMLGARAADGSVSAARASDRAP